MKAKIDKRKCPSDNRMCKPLKECPVQAIHWVEDEDEPLGSRMEVDEAACTGCGKCAALCCGSCITVE